MNLLVLDKFVSWLFVVDVELSSTLATTDIYLLSLLLHYVLIYI